MTTQSSTYDPRTGQHTPPDRVSRRVRIDKVERDDKSMFIATYRTERSVNGELESVERQRMTLNRKTKKAKWQNL